MKQKIEHLFKAYPTVDEWHVTSDEQAFEEKHHAQSHARSLEKKEKDGSVKSFKRGEPTETEKAANGIEITEPVVVKETPDKKAAEAVKKAPQKAASKK